MEDRLIAVIAAFILMDLLLLVSYPYLDGHWSPTLPTTRELLATPSVPDFDSIVRQYRGK